MAEDPTNNYDVFLAELERVSTLDAKVTSMKKSQNQILTEIEEVKEFVGIEESDNQRNVVGKDKLPTTLKANERKRYENIGKQFVEGAGREFERIRKAVKFRDAMRTTKDTFLKGIDKLKMTVKKASKKGGFWTNLLKIVGVLSLIAFIFKDKIAKALPNLKENVEKVFDTVKGTVKHLIDKIFGESTTLVSGSFVAIVNRMFTQTLPGLASNFFNYTLPEVILNTYLAVLSTFSETAGQRLSENLNKDMNDLSEQVADDAEVQAELRTIGNLQEQKNVIQGVENLYNTIQQLAAKGEASDADVRDFIKNAGILAWSQSSIANAQAAEQLDSIVDAVNGNNVNLRQLIDSGNFDMTTFLNQYQSYLNEGENKETALFNSLSNLMGKKDLDEAQKQEVLQKIREQTKNGAVFQLMTAMISNQNKYENEANSILTQNAARDKVVLIEQERMKRMIEQPPLQVDYKEVFEGEVAKSLKDFLDKFSKFIEGNKLTPILEKGFTSIAEHYKNFFEQSINVLNNAVSGITGIIFDGTKDVQTVFTSPTQVNGDNNIIINVDLSDSTAGAFAMAINNLYTADNSIVKILEKTNEKLQEAVNAFSTTKDLHAASMKYVEISTNNLHEIVDKKEAMAWKQININSRDIMRLDGEIHDQKQQSYSNDYVPVIMLPSCQ